MGDENGTKRGVAQVPPGRRHRRVRAGHVCQHHNHRDVLAAQGGHPARQRRLRVLLPVRQQDPQVHVQRECPIYIFFLYFPLRNLRKLTGQKIICFVCPKIIFNNTIEQLGFHGYFDYNVNQ